MKLRLIALVLAAAVSLPGWQERHTTTYVYDFEGRRMPWTSASSSNGRYLESTRNLNGRETPVEKVEERILRDEGGVRVIERLVRRFDPSGQPLPPEKTVVEETREPGGLTVTRTSLFRGDVNGRLQLAERSTAQTREAEGSAQRELLIERPTLNGSWEPVEKRVATTRGTAESSETQEVIYRPDAARRFTEAARTVLKQTMENGRAVEQRDEYEAASTGAMQLSRQTVSRAVRQPDGSERREVDVFGVAAPGRPASGQLHLRERQFIDRRVMPDGSTVESFSIQRPSLNSTRELGPVQKISETVCRGDCLPKPRKD